MRDGLIQFAFVQVPHFPKHLFMHPVKHGPEVRRARVLGRVGVRHRLVPEEAPVRLRDQFAVLGLDSSNAPQRQAVLGIRQVADLPADVTDPAGRLPKPLGHGSLVEEFDGVVAGEDDLLDSGAVQCHERLGGVLRYYYRQAA
jgi:hypothetical protein